MINFSIEFINNDISFHEIVNSNSPITNPTEMFASITILNIHVFYLLCNYRISLSSQ